MSGPLPSDEPTVFLVPNDPAVARMVKTHATPKRLDIVAYASLHEFVDTCGSRTAGCVLWEPRQPVNKSLKLLQEVAWKRIFLPVIVHSAQADVSTVVRAMRAGARDFLLKPCHPARLGEAVSDAIVWEAQNRRRLNCVDRMQRWLGKFTPGEQEVLQRRLAGLTPGEHEVLNMVLHGDSNRDIATELGLSIRTIEVRRSNVMKKMKARSLAELICAVLAASCGLAGSTWAQEITNASAFRGSPGGALRPITGRPGRSPK